VFSCIINWSIDFFVFCIFLVGLGGSSSCTYTDNLATDSYTDAKSFLFNFYMFQCDEMGEKRA